MQRRGFLVRGVLGGLVLAVSGALGVALRPGDASVSPTRPLHALDARSFPVLVAVAARVMAGSTAVPQEIAHGVDHALRFGSPEARKDVNAALLLLENGLGGLLTRGSATPFTLLDETAQDAALYRFRDSSLVLLRSAYHAFRKLCVAAHYANPASWPETTFPGPVVRQGEPPAIAARAPLAVDAALLDVDLPDASSPDAGQPSAEQPVANADADTGATDNALDGGAP